MHMYGSTKEKPQGQHYQQRQQHATTTTNDETATTATTTGLSTVTTNLGGLVDVVALEGPPLLEVADGVVVHQQHVAEESLHGGVPVQLERPTHRVDVHLGGDYPLVVRRLDTEVHTLVAVRRSAARQQTRVSPRNFLI